MGQLGHYLRQSPDDWKQVCLKASQKNPWFTPEFIELSTQSITKEFLDEEKLTTLSRDRKSVD